MPPESTDCVLCHSELPGDTLQEQSSPVGTLPCGHIFHVNCVLRHSEKSGKCPSCHASFCGLNDVTRIFYALKKVHQKSTVGENLEKSKLQSKTPIEKALRKSERERIQFQKRIVELEEAVLQAEKKKKESERECKVVTARLQVVENRCNRAEEKTTGLLQIERIREIASKSDTKDSQALLSRFREMSVDTKEMALLAFFESSNIANKNAKEYLKCWEEEKSRVVRLEERLQAVNTQLHEQQSKVKKLTERKNKFEEEKAILQMQLAMSGSISKAASHQATSKTSTSTIQGKKEESENNTGSEEGPRTVSDRQTSRSRVPRLRQPISFSKASLGNRGNIDNNESPRRVIDRPALPQNKLGFIRARNTQASNGNTIQPGMSVLAGSPKTHSESSSRKMLTLDTGVFKCDSMGSQKRLPLSPISPTNSALTGRLAKTISGVQRSRSSSFDVNKSTSAISKLLEENQRPKSSAIADRSTKRSHRASIGALQEPDRQCLQSWLNDR